jgi:hypothetical protein
MMRVGVVVALVVSVDVEGDKEVSTCSCIFEALTTNDVKDNHKVSHKGNQKRPR